MDKVIITTNPTTAEIEESRDVTVIATTNNPVVIEPRQDAVIVITEKGSQGRQGEVGLDKHFTYTQPTPSATWAVPHALGKHPSVTVVDSAGTEVEGCVTHNNLNQLTIEFSSPFSGKAYLN